MAERMVPGEVLVGEEPIRANVGRRTVTIQATNTSVWPVHVGSHFHFFEVNRRLRFDRAAAFGMHLDILAGATVRWEPGQTREVRLVEYVGRREVYGNNGLVEGPLTEANKAAALARARERGFLDSGAQ
ncbi:MAG TPA: urease subunit beta [Chloroflexota bacterium]|nr:urease subunit beta [Chloroflexota bacterium]